MTSPSPSPPSTPTNVSLPPPLAAPSPTRSVSDIRLTMAQSPPPSPSTPQPASPATRDLPALRGVLPRGSPPAMVLQTPSPLSIPASALNFQGTILLPAATPYLVLGFGTHGSRSWCPETGGFMCGPGPPFAQISAEVIISSGTEDRVPWSRELILVSGFALTAKVSLPPYTDVVGAASDVACFPPGSMRLFQFDKYSLAEFPDGSKYSGARGIIYPVRYPRTGRIVCRRTKSDIRSHPKDHLISAGFAVTPACSVAEVGEDIAEPHGAAPQFSILSQNYAVREFDPTRTKLHDPYFMRDLPACLRESEQNAATGLTGLTVHIRGVPYLVTIFCIFLLVCPGMVQAYGSHDHKWGDIVNAAIGTGSVLLGVVFVVFQRIFGSDITSIKAFRGIFTIRSNLGARIFARGMVQEIAEMACDPRIPVGLIDRYKNCAVRTDRTGWLKVGQSIKLSDMGKHGYYVLKDRGLLLDLVDARYYTCSKIGNVVHINRPGQQSNENRCYEFDGHEVFEGE